MEPLNEYRILHKFGVSNIHGQVLKRDTNITTITILSFEFK